MTIPDSKKNIMVHTLAVRSDWYEGKTVAQKMKEVKRWHVKERGWRDVAYAKIIDRDGKTAKGRDLDGDGDVWEETGAGATGWNTNTIHIALVGGFGSNADDKFEDHYTAAQDKALRKEIATINREAGRTLHLMGHHEVANKACPCFRVRPWFNSVKQEQTSMFAAIIAAILRLFTKG